MTYGFISIQLKKQCFYEHFSFFNIDNNIYCLHWFFYSQCSILLDKEINKFYMSFDDIIIVKMW